MPTVSLDQLRLLEGCDLGTSGWFDIKQARIDAFAEATDDRQFIHVDPAMAAQTPFGGTIAHGFLSLSLLSRMAVEVLPLPSSLKMVVNYGFERVRFIAPVRSGTRIRGHFYLERVEDRAPGQLLLRLQATVQIEGSERPAVTADWLALLMV
jgi:acyl dehydratase